MRLAAAAALLIAIAAGAAVTSRGGPAERPPIVFLVFDALPSPMLSSAPDRLDAQRFPNFARLARDATWYRNATTVNDSTVKSIPAMLDGRWPNNLRHPTLRDHPANLFTLLRSHYSVVADEEGTELCPPDVCRTQKARRILYLLHGGREQRFDKWVAAIRPLPKPGLWYMHTLFPHEPLRYLPSGKVYAPGSDPEPSLDGNESFDDEFLTRQAEQRHLLQLRWTDVLLGRLLDRLHATGLYDRALIVVTADHGMSFRRKPTPSEPYRLGQIGWRRDLTRYNAQDVAFVPLFVKKPDQHDGRTDDGWVRTVDILPMMLRAARVRAPHGLAGRALGGNRPRLRALAVVTNRRGPITLDPMSMERRRAATIARRAGIFDAGADNAQLFRIGPHPELIGRRVSGLPALPRTGVRARRYGPRRYVDVRLDRHRIPAHVTGWIDGGEPGGRDLAIAVNGRIAAVARSFAPIGERRMSLSALLPESAFRQGRNDIAIFEVGTDVPRLSLMPLMG
jgi:hypothetical protein